MQVSISLECEECSMMLSLVDINTRQRTRTYRCDGCGKKIIAHYGI